MSTELVARAHVSERATDVAARLALHAVRIANTMREISNFDRIKNETQR